MKYLRYSIIFWLLIIIFRSDGVRVCKTWPDYLNPFNKDCFENPGSESNVTQILQRWGCTVEEFQLLTEDGYYILVVRATMAFVRNHTPIIMGHGIYMNSLGFVLMFNKSIAYQLLEKGHEVYFINFRGTRYSTGHKTLTNKDEAYWKFSFHQMAEFDIPAGMDLVAQKTNCSKAIYIGYSMGTTVINIYSILYPEEATRRLSGIVELAPVANLTDIRSILGIIYPLWPIVKPLANLIWHGTLFPRNPLLLKLCSRHLIGIFLCTTIAGLIAGPNYQMLDPLRQPVIYEQYPDVLSATLIEHYYQIVRSKKFQQYDHGSKGNMKEYGTAFPPIYDFSKLMVPIMLYVGANDYIAEAKNSRALYDNIPRGSRCGFKMMPDPYWTHLSFIWSKDMALYQNGAILNTITIMESNSCGSSRNAVP